MRPDSQSGEYPAIRQRQHQTVTRSGTFPTVKSASSRIPGLDAARAFATFGIVWVHVAEEQGVALNLVALGRFGTSFYIVAAILLASRGSFLRPDLKKTGWVRQRAKRLLLPFLVWSGVYAAFYLGTMLPQGYSVAQIARFWSALGGTAGHLWFLPFAFVAGTVATWIVPHLMRLSVRQLASLGAMTTISAYVVVYGGVLSELDRAHLTSIGLHRINRWIEEAPIALGALFGSALYGKLLEPLGRLGRRRRLRLAGVVLGLFFAIQLAYAVFLDELRPYVWTEVRAFANLAGSLWLVAFLAARRGPWIERLAPLGRATYFAYLAHLLLIDVSKVGLAELPGHGTIVFALATSLAVFAASVTIGMLARHVRAMRWLVP